MQSRLRPTHFSAFSVPCTDLRSPTLSQLSFSPLPVCPASCSIDGSCCWRSPPSARPPPFQPPPSRIPGDSCLTCTRPVRDDTADWCRNCGRVMCGSCMLYVGMSQLAAPFPRSARTRSGVLWLRPYFEILWLAQRRRFLSSDGDSERVSGADLLIEILTWLEWKQGVHVLNCGGMSSAPAIGAFPTHARLEHGDQRPMHIACEAV